MQITTTVRLDVDDRFTLTPDEAAHAVLEALHGDTTKDTCTVTVAMPTGVTQPDSETLLPPPEQPL